MDFHKTSKIDILSKIGDFLTNGKMKCGLQSIFRAKAPTNVVFVGLQDLLVWKIRPNGGL
jgi:hypothetical protein